MQTTLAERLEQAMAGPPRVTGRALAKACNVSPPSVSDWLNGKSKSMEGKNLLSAAAFLRVRPKWLAEGVGAMRDSDPAPADPAHRAAEPTVAFLPEPPADKLRDELLELFSQLDEAGKKEWLADLRGFVRGRRPHPHGTASALAVK